MVSASGPIRNPGLPWRTTKPVRPPGRPRWSISRAKTLITPAQDDEFHRFQPRIRQPPLPSRFASVAIPPTFTPAAGSLSAKAAISRPLARRGSHSWRTGGVAYPSIGRMPLTP